MLSQADLERRRMFLTATDVPCIIGVNKYKNAHDVYLEKTQSLRPWDGNDATEAGNLLEPAILAWARTKLGPINEGEWRVHENGINAATLDGILPNREVVECKSHGIVCPADWDAWGKEGTDDIPDVYAIQVQAQMLVTGAERTWIPALIGGRGFLLYTMERHPDIQEMILAASERFWKRVQDREPPADVPHLETLKRMDRIVGKVVEVDDLVASRYLRACEEAKAANDVKEEAQEALLAAIGDAEGAKWNGGEFTYRMQHRRSFTVEASSFRVLRTKQKEAVSA
jgi:putative phage-type endonuclease